MQTPSVSPQLPLYDHSPRSSLQLPKKKFPNKKFQPYYVWTETDFKLEVNHKIRVFAILAYAKPTCSTNHLSDMDIVKMRIITTPFS